MSDKIEFKALNASFDSDTHAWYLSILDEPVHHSTEGVPVTIDWSRDGSMIGVEILPDARPNIPLTLKPDVPYLEANTKEEPGTIRDKVANAIAERYLMADGLWTWQNLADAAIAAMPTIIVHYGEAETSVDPSDFPDVDRGDGHGA